MTALWSRIGVCTVACALAVSSSAQGGDQLNGQADYTCETAIWFCNDLLYSVVDDASEDDCCLWFTFYVPYEQVVEITVSQLGASPGSALHASLYGPETDGEDCTWAPACDDTGTWPFEVDDSAMDPGYYYIAIREGNGALPCTGMGTIRLDVLRGDLGCPPVPCGNCIQPFGPEEDSTYILNAWAKEEGAPFGTTEYADPRIIIQTLDGGGAPLGTPVVITCSGPIVDGWQRMEGEVTIDAGSGGLSVTLECDNDACFFDDIRMFPKSGSMKSYVYDPTTLRFTAELDERHYATFYEYDGEGKLVRVKKETERGIMTIQETRYNSSKLSGN